MKSLGRRPEGTRLERLRASRLWTGEAFRNVHPVLPGLRDPNTPPPTLRAFLFGIVAVVGIQFLFVGSAYPWLHCSAFANVTGALLIGLAPLMLAYLIVAALASLMASASEK